MVVMLMAILSIFIAYVTLMGNSSNTPTYSYGDLLNDIKSGKVTKLEISANTDVTGAGKARAYFSTGDSKTVNFFGMETFTSFVMHYQDIYNFKVDTLNTPIISFLQLFVHNMIFIFIIIFMSLIMNKSQSYSSGSNKVMNFGKSRAKIYLDTKKSVMFSNVAGLDEEKKEVEELVDFLKQPKKYIDIGARIPKGVLLVGPPGTGKTLLAKAIAGEAGVPFLSIAGSDFVEMFAGVGASRVRDLFEQAKKNVPCIVFIDEIDAVGRKRGGSFSGGNDEREQTLNQLLVEMDGFGVNTGIIIIAATNRPDILDPALLRPGRFDRQVVVDRPDVKGRKEILEVHAKGKALDENVDLQIIAQTTPGFTGADLENLLNEAALLSARENKKKIYMEELRKAFVKIGIGTEKKSKVISEKERKITAYHEAGHAILEEMLEELDGVHMISIIPTGRAGGYTMQLPGEDKSYLSKTRMKQEIMSLLGGRAAEEIVFGDITTGASNDIERATSIARNMVTKYGMSDTLGPIQFGEENSMYLGQDSSYSKNYGEKVATTIDNEVSQIITEAYNNAKDIIKSNIDILNKAVNLLMEKEKITGKEFRDLFPYGVLPNKNIQENKNNTFLEEE